MTATRRTIMESLAGLLRTLPWATSVEYERVVTALSQIPEHAVPYIQFYDGGASNQHQKGLVEVSMQVAIEVILRNTITGEVNQGDLSDKMEDIETLLGDNPQLGIQGVRHVVYDGYATDLHADPVYLVGILQFTVIYLRPYGVC